jgi:hypothetical protein
MTDGLARVDSLLRSGTTTDLQADVLRAMSLYSGGMVFSTIEHRLLHALVAVESLLLKDDSESIVASLAPRMAHISGETVPERRGIVSDFREA